MKASGIQHWPNPYSLMFKPRKKIEYLKVNIHHEDGQLKSINNYLSIICISKNVIDVLISKTSKKIHKASNWIIGHWTVLVVNFHRWTPTHFGKYLNQTYNEVNMHSIGIQCFKSKKHVDWPVIALPNLRSAACTSKKKRYNFCRTQTLFTRNKLASRETCFTSKS